MNNSPNIKKKEKSSYIKTCDTNAAPCLEICIYNSLSSKKMKYMKKQ